MQTPAHPSARRPVPYPAIVLGAAATGGGLDGAGVGAAVRRDLSPA